MRRKSKFKVAVEKALKKYYEKGLTNTADRLRKDIIKEFSRIQNRTQNRTTKRKGI